MVRILCFGGVSRAAHRYSWELANGPIPLTDNPHDTCILHRCDNPPCVNPAHLWLGTHKENMQDKGKKGRAATVSGVTLNPPREVWKYDR